ncbi:MAG: tetratricopeptide repeat protein [Candidatus Heimdallarchaeota archaeon]
MNWEKRIRKEIKNLSSEYEILVFRALHSLVIGIEAKQRQVLKKHDVDTNATEATEELVEKVNEAYKEIKLIWDETSVAIFNVFKIHKERRVGFLAIDALGYIGGDKAYELLMNLYQSTPLEERLRYHVELSIGKMNKMLLFKLIFMESEDNLRVYEEALASKTWAIDIQSNLFEYANEKKRSGDKIIYLNTQRLVTELFPEEGNAWFNIGQFHLSQGQYKEAVPYLERTIKINGNDHAALHGLGHAFLHLQQFRKALPYLDRAIKLHPDEMMYWLSRGLVNQQLKDKRKAQRDIEQVCRLDPNNMKFRELLNQIKYS